MSKSNLFLLAFLSLFFTINYSFSSELKLPEPKDRTQFILISFDATPRKVDSITDQYMYKFIKRLRDYGKSLNAEYDPSMTIFTNTKILMLPSNWKPPTNSIWAADDDLWRPYLFDPAFAPGNVIPFGENPTRVEKSAEILYEFDKMGVEIASHSVRHLHARKLNWGIDEWEKEFELHKSILQLHNLPDNPLGFRAPFLETSLTGMANKNDAMYQVMQKHGMRYDSSKGYYSFPHKWPSKISGTDIWELAVPITLRPGSSNRVLFFGDVGGISYSEYEAISLREFNARYGTEEKPGPRSPFLFSGHGERIGETEMILKKICFKKNVRCTSFRDFVEYMDELEN